MSAEELEESIDWHAEEHIPYDLADVSLDYQVTAEHLDSTHVLIAACKRERIDNITPGHPARRQRRRSSSTSTHSPCRTATRSITNPTDNEVVTLLNIGASTMNVNIVKGTRRYSHATSRSAAASSPTCCSEASGLSFQQAEAVKRGVSHAVEGIEEKSIEPLMNNVTEIVAMEIQKTFDFYRATTEDNRDRRAEDPYLRRRLKAGGPGPGPSRRLELPVEVLDPFRNIKVDQANSTRIISARSCPKWPLPSAWQ